MVNQKRIPIHKCIWSNVRCFQSKNDISDNEIAKCLGVSTRTLYTYDKNAKNITLEKVESFINRYGVDISGLIS